MHQINQCFLQEVINIFHYQVVHIFIHQERGDELVIISTIKDRNLATSYRFFFFFLFPQYLIRESFEKMLLLIWQCNTCLQEIMMVYS